MKRMPIIKLLIATLVSVGLVLSPVVAANAMAAMPAAPMDGGGPATTTSSPDKPCPCCDLTSKCVAAICTTACVQLGVPDPIFYVALAGHTVLTYVVPPMPQGRGWQPPTPPPRG